MGRPLYFTAVVSMFLLFLSLWPLPSDFYLSSFFLSIFFSSPNVSGRRVDVYDTFTHDVALVRIYNACLKCAAHGSRKYRMQKIAILAPSHKFVGLILRS